MAEIDAWIGLGSNLNEPETRIRTALDDLRRLEGCTLQAASALYRSPPMGPAGQPDYINAVARLTTMLSPEALLDALQTIERQHAAAASATGGRAPWILTCCCMVRR